MAEHVAHLVVPVDRHGRDQDRADPGERDIDDDELVPVRQLHLHAVTGPQPQAEQCAVTGGTNTIDFAIPGSGVHTILPLSPLPAFVNPVLIDGSSQPGYDDAPLIEIDGSQAGTADGLTITGSGVTVLGLDIDRFADGAGILLSGAGATGDTIEDNFIGTDPTGLQALPDEFGVRIVGGADNNLIGGTTTAAGNLIAFDTGPGVNVEGDSVGDQITSNRIYGDNTPPMPGPAGALQFQGSSYVSLPNGLIDDAEPSETLEAWFQTTSGGVILGFQSSSAGSDSTPDQWDPEIYVGTDGRLYAGAYATALASGEQVTSPGPVNDGRWHEVALVIDGQSDTMTAYLDGRLLGTVPGTPEFYQGSFDQIGTGYTEYWAAAPDGWDGFVGEIDDVRVWGKARTAAEIGQDMTTELIGNESGLEADYPLDEGQGLTAHDQTPNGNDGTLAGLNGGLPAWVVPGNAGIDLGDDGITANSTRSSTAGALQFEGSNYVSLPNGLIDGAEPSETLEAWFQTTSGGVILGYQSSSAASDFAPDQWDPEIYVGTDGKLYGGAYDTDLGSIEQVTSTGPVNDGRWHEVALVIDGQSDTMTVYLDGQLVGSVSGSPEFYQGSFDQIGTGYTDVLGGGARRLVWLRRPDRRRAGLERGAVGRRDQPGHDHRAERGRTGPGGRLSPRRRTGADRV